MSVDLMILSCAVLSRPGGRVGLAPERARPTRTTAAKDVRGGRGQARWREVRDRASDLEGSEGAAGAGWAFQS